MSNFSQRLNKLEPPPQHSEYLKEVGLRLLRYLIETHNQVQTGKLSAQYWEPEQEEMYQQQKKDPEFDAFEREILANQTRDEPKTKTTADS